MRIWDRLSRHLLGKEDAVLVGGCNRISLAQSGSSIVSFTGMTWESILVEADAKAGAMAQGFEIYELSHAPKDRGAGWLMLSCADPAACGWIMRV